MRDYYDLDTVPLEENCFPAGHEKSYAEAQIFCAQVVRAYPPPFYCSVSVKLNDHDFPYYSVRLKYNDAYDEHMDWFFSIDNDNDGKLKKWDEIALQERKEQGLD